MCFCHSSAQAASKYFCSFSCCWLGPPSITETAGGWVVGSELEVAGSCFTTKATKPPGAWGFRTRWLGGVYAHRPLSLGVCRGGPQMSCREDLISDRAPMHKEGPLFFFWPGMPIAPGPRPTQTHPARARARTHTQAGIPLLLVFSSSLIFYKRDSGPQGKKSARAGGVHKSCSKSP